MPDENVTEAIRPDAVSAEESLFGEGANGTVTKPVEERNADEKNEQDPHGSEDAEKEDVKEESAEDPQHVGNPEDGDATEGELKIVVSIKGTRATIGVQRPSSDPHIESFKDAELSVLAQEVPAVVQRAGARWEKSLKQPAYVRPAPARRRRNQRQASVEGITAEAGTDNSPQQAMRLL